MTSPRVLQYYRNLASRFYKKCNKLNIAKAIFVVDTSRSNLFSHDTSNNNSTKVIYGANKTRVIYYYRTRRDV